MAIVVPNGKYQVDNTGTTVVSGPTSGDWTTVPATWAGYTGWLTAPSTLTWLSNIVDMGSVLTFTIEIQANIAGTVTYHVYTSSTGDFAGEETTVTINEGDTDIPAFTGRFVLIGIEVAYVNSEGIPTIRSFKYIASTNTNTVYLSDINTADLDGITSNKELVFDRGSSKVVNISLTGHKADEYFVADYVSNLIPTFTNCSEIAPPPDPTDFDPGWNPGDPSPPGYDEAFYLWQVENCDVTYSGESTELYIESPRIPLGGIVSKGSVPIIAFTLNNEFTEAVFDATLTILPKQSMSGRNLVLS